MAFENMVSVSFTDAELKQIDDALAALEKVLKPKLVQLTAEQNVLYGKLGNSTENWAEMIYNDCKTMPDLVPEKVVDTDEWDIDAAARKQILPRVSRLEALADNLSATNRLIGFDLYTACRSVYNSVKLEAAQGVPGTKAYYDKWSVQFPGRKSAKKAPIAVQAE